MTQDLQQQKAITDAELRTKAAFVCVLGFRHHCICCYSRVYSCKKKAQVKQNIKNKIPCHLSFMHLFLLPFFCLCEAFLAFLPFVPHTLCENKVRCNSCSSHPHMPELEFVLEHVHRLEILINYLIKIIH